MKPHAKTYILNNYPQQTVAQIAKKLKITERKVRKVTDKIKKNPNKQAGVPAPRVEPQKIFLAVLLLIGLGTIIYANSLGGAFIWDDISLVKDNSYIRAWHNLPKILSKNIGAGAISEYSFYRPLQVMTYLLDYSLWRLNPMGYHLTSIGVHILTAVSILFFISYVTGQWPLALTSALLFAAHPVHTETVSYISGRADSLSALFMLLSAILYIRPDREGRPPGSLLALGTYALALLSKENSLILPFLLLVYHYSFRRPVKIKRFLPVCVMAAGYLLLRVTWLKSLLSHTSHSTTFWQRLPGFFAALTNYFRVLLFPLELRMEYGSPLFRFSDPAVIMGILILTALLVLLYRNKDRRGLPTFCVLWFIVALLPCSNLYPINAYMAEHWLYLPSLGVFLGIAFLLISVRDKFPRHGRFFNIVTVTLVLSLSLLTIRQNNYWRDPVSFCLRTLKYAPHSVQLNNAMGQAYNNRDQFHKAIPYLKKAIQLNPRYYKAYNNLGIAFYRTGEFDKAVSVLEAALKIYPGYAKGSNTLAASYLMAGKVDQAITTYRKTVAINPDYPQAYYNWGNIYLKMGKFDEAKELFEKAITLKPDYANAYASLAATLQQTGRHDDARAAYQQAVRFNPDLKITPRPALNK